MKLTVIRVFLRNGIIEDLSFWKILTKLINLTNFNYNASKDRFETKVSGDSTFVFANSIADSKAINNKIFTYLNSITGGFHFPDKAIVEELFYIKAKFGYKEISIGNMIS